MTAAPGDLAEDAALMVAVRRQLHAHPELGFAETRTASCVASLLAGWGFEVAHGVGGTGVVASLSHGPGRCVGLRAELDALPLAEKGVLPYASVTPLAMHACGHDGHMAILLAAGRYLARTRRFAGTVRLVFQPAEEGLGGAARMLACGLLDRFPCDALFALHNAPDQRADTVAVRAGVMAAAGDWFDVRVATAGGHAAASGAGADAAVVAASMVMALQTVVSRQVGPFEATVVHVGSVQAGACAGVSADAARLLVTVRTLEDACRTRVLDAVQDIIRAQAAGYGAQAEVIAGCSYPKLLNSAEETQLVVNVAREVVGDARVVPPRSVLPVMASDDFAVLLQHCPGCYFVLGTQGRPGMRLHHPEYDFNDGCLQTGAALLARIAERFLPAGASPLAERTLARV